MNSTWKIFYLESKVQKIFYLYKVKRRMGRKLKRADYVAYKQVKENNN